VTGANGSVARSFIGRAARAHRVEAVARSAGAPEENCRLQVADLVDYEKWQASASSASHIVHLAASRSDSKEKDLYQDIPIAGRLLDCWKRGQFIFAGSQIVYSQGSDGPLDENSPCGPYNWYGASKLAIEHMIRVQFARNRRQPGFEGGYVILRIPPVAHSAPGKNQFLEPLVRSVTMGLNFCFDCPKEQAGRYGSSWIGIDDLSRALFHATGEIASGIYNVDSGYVRTVDVLEMMIGKLGSRSRILYNCKGMGIDIPLTSTRLNTDKIRSAGFEPRDTLEGIVERALAGKRQ